METEVISKDIQTVKDKIANLKILVSSVDNFREGAYCDVIDEVKTWCVGRVIEKNGETVKVHFEAWPSKYDEVIL